MYDIMGKLIYICTFFYYQVQLGNPNVKFSNIFTVQINFININRKINLEIPLYIII